MAMFDSFVWQIIIFAGMGLAAACQWMGIVKLAKIGQKNSWLTMLAGAVLHTISLPVLLLGFLILSLNPTQDFDSLMGWFKAVSAGQVLGNILFFTGFLLHCLSISKRQDRVRELESIIAAQAQELDRYRNAPR